MADSRINAQQVALKIVVAVGDAIRELSTSRPLGGVPSGELYAVVMAAMPSMTIRDYEAVVGVLKRAGLVEEKGHLLKWVGPIPRGN